MPQTVKSYAALSANTPLVPHTIERHDLRDTDVKLDIHYCGVCHSDLHSVRNDWGWSSYPIVPGHEIIGRVTEIGGKVKNFKVGDLVGIGCMVDSCRECPPCLHGEENYCEKGHTLTYGSLDPVDGMMTYGGYSKSYTVNQDFLLKIPENLDTKAVAPILCAGITVWSPLKHWNVGQGSKVGVIGLGGLGHMAIKLAKALGAEVILFSRSVNKFDDARRLGADRVIISSDETQMQSVTNQLDVIIDTVPYEHDVNPYLHTLTLNGTLVLVGLVGEIAEKMQTTPLLLGRRSIAGSVIGGIKETQELLDFCGAHNIVSDVEMIKMAEINHAYERMEKSDVKYRFVIDMASF
ncbi:NAD(P)-dependent alcohol dehydrogenase [Neisseria sp. CCUG17229]|uniref:NAD(P)-dependent alcohol dehydrogenase n=1 Tax=Neisseria sp. CCUG17229 TaxID=3392036 RepID=UPI003A0FC8FE